MNFGVVIDALTQIVVDIINFIPNLINGLIILILGYLIARIIRWLLRTILRRIHFDPLVERTGITGAIRGLGVKTLLSTILAQTVFALLLISFLITSTRLMGLEAVALLLERLLNFLPNIIAALIVFLIGGIVAQFTGNLVTALATGGGLVYGARVGRLVQYLISVFVVIFALGVLGLDTSILVTALTLALAAFGLAVGLSLGLGARTIVQHVLAGYYLRQRFAMGQRIVMAQIDGEVSGIGGVNTLVRTNEGTMVVPNTVLLESVVKRRHRQEEMEHLNNPEPRPRGGDEPAQNYDRASIWMRCAYFFQYAGIGAYSPYLTLYYRTLGLSGADIGILAAIQPLATALLAPLWGLAADRWGVHRALLRTGLVGAAVAVLVLLGANTFWQFLPLIAMLAFFVSPSAPLLDSYGVTISERRGIAFGSIRIWGSLGYIASTWLGGWLMGGSVSRWFLAAYAITLLVVCASTFGLPTLKLRSSARSWHGAATVVRQPAMIVLLLTFFLISCSTTPSYAFFGIYLTEIGGGTGLVGTASALSAVSELPIMVLGGWLLRKWGARRMLAFALLVYTIRFALYSIISLPYWVLPVQLLHGLTFGLYLMSSVTLMHEMLGKQYAATAQGLLSSTYAFGQITGSLVGGVLLDRYGIFVIFRLAAGVMFLALLVLLAGTWLLERRSVTEP